MFRQCVMLLIAAVQREFPAVHAPDKGVDPIDGALWRARTGSSLSYR